jgi:hypothetical protein
MRRYMCGARGHADQPCADPRGGLGRQAHGTAKALVAADHQYMPEVSLVRVPRAARQPFVASCSSLQDASCSRGTQA